MNYTLLLIPIIAAIGGWLLIRTAIWFVFHPAQSKKIAGVKIQGILPANQPQLASAIGEYSLSLFSSSSIEEKISNPANLEKILPMIENHIDDFLRNKLTKELPMIGMFIGDKTIGKVKDAFLKEIVILFPQIMKEYASSMKQDLDPRQKITAKIAAMPLGPIEAAFKTNYGKQLRKAQLAGAAFGLVIGLVQLALILLVA